jgi:hypothetical protein
MRKSSETAPGQASPPGPDSPGEIVITGYGITGVLRVLAEPHRRDIPRGGAPWKMLSVIPAYARGARHAVLLTRESVTPQNAQDPPKEGLAMSRFIRRGALALPALLITLITAAAVTVPAQAADNWSALPLPFSVGSQGFAENASGAQVAASTTGIQGESSVVVATSANGLTWSAPLTIDTGENPGTPTSCSATRARRHWPRPSRRLSTM